jgi:hypothetical protein
VASQSRRLLRAGQKRGLPPNYVALAKFSPGLTWLGLNWLKDSKRSKRHATSFPQTLIAGTAPGWTSEPDIATGVKAYQITRIIRQAMQQPSG